MIEGVQQKIVATFIVLLWATLSICSGGCKAQYTAGNITTDHLSAAKVDANIVIETMQYYDNRKAVVIFTGDDWCGGIKHHSGFMKTCDAAQKYRVVFSPGFITGLPELDYPPPLQSRHWQDIQTRIDEGFISPASHSTSHPGGKYSYTNRANSYEIEIGGSKKAIIDNLALPPQNWFNGSEYMVAWIEPYGKSNNKIMTTLAASNYLVSRSTVLNQSSWGRWDNTHGLYRCGLTTDLRSLSLTNSRFDNVYSKGGIYHFNIHPAKYNWQNNDTLLKHLQHLSNKTDIWYVGFGQAYMYHYLVDRVKPTIRIISNTNQKIIVKISVPGTERNKYGLSYPITYKVSIPGGWPNLRVYSKNGTDEKYTLMTEKTASDFFNGIDAYRKNLSEKYVYISKAFPQASNEFYLKIERAKLN